MCTDVPENLYANLLCNNKKVNGWRYAPIYSPSSASVVLLGSKWCRQVNVDLISN